MYFFLNFLEISALLCTCSDLLLNNGKCDQECNTKECNFDNNECKYKNFKKSDDSGYSLGMLASIAVIVGSSSFV